MRKFLVLTLLLVSNIGYSQLHSVVTDSETKESIPYVNIWVENENVGTTSDEDGSFELDVDSTRVIVFSAIGYETKHISSDSIQSTLELKQMITELGEVVVRPEKVEKKRDQQLVIGEFKKSKVNSYLVCHGKPWIWARYFEYKEEYEETNFLLKIKLLTQSDIKDSKFNVRLFARNAVGEPEGYIYDGNIVGVAKKGKKVTTVDLSGLNIEFPKEGFFIAVEWLIIEDNKHEYQFTMEGSKKKHYDISYEPSFGTVPAITNESSWCYSKGKWRKAWFKNNSKHKAYDHKSLRHYRDKYQLLAMELFLTN